jgi:hypothetical protein
MIEMGIKKTINTYLEPVFDAQQMLVRDVEERMDGPLEQISDRVTLLEQAVFGKLGPTNRFELMEETLSQARKHWA